MLETLHNPQKDLYGDPRGLGWITPPPYLFLQQKQVLVPTHYEPSKLLGLKLCLFKDLLKHSVQRKSTALLKLHSVSHVGPAIVTTLETSFKVQLK